MMDLGPRLGPDDWAPLRHCLSRNPSGWALEFGVGKGDSLRLIAAQMPVIGFDSFDGLPEDWRPDYPTGTFAQSRIPDIEGATIVTGLFIDTLPDLDWPDEVGLIHFDADLYSSTATALAFTAHFIKPGVFIVFDEFHGYDGAEEHEQKAWNEFANVNDISYQVLGHSRESVAFQITEGSREWAQE